MSHLKFFGRRALALLTVLCMLLCSGATAGTVMDEATAAGVAANVQTEPTEKAVAEPTIEPTEEPTAEPTAELVEAAAEEATGESTAEPVAEATEEATGEPIEEATVEPTIAPTEEAVAEPTAEPVAEATEEATGEAIEEATVEPTIAPTEEAIAEPTAEPVAEPTEEATEEPIEPTAEPTPDSSAEAGNTPAPETTPSIEENQELQIPQILASQSERTACAHTDAWYAWYFDDNQTYKDIDRIGHTTISERVKHYYCDECGKDWLDESTREIFELRSAHYAGDAENGVCACGYKCPHANTYILFIIEQDVTYRSVGETHHTYSGVCDVYYECEDCGYGYYKEVTLTNQREAHSFRNGYCEYCGEKYVEHDCVNAILLETTRRYVVKCLDSNETKHKCEYEVVETYYCPDCKTYFDVENTVVRWETHRFEGAECIDCGYQREIECQHLNTYTEEEVIYGDCIYSSFNPETHTTFAYDVGRFTYCSDCGECLDYAEYENIVANTPVTKPHHYNGYGECVDCGYVKGDCEHANVDSREVCLEGTYTSLNRTQHKGTGYWTTAYTCRDCGESWTEYPGLNKTTKTRNHSFGAADSTGRQVCSDCGYTNTALTITKQPTSVKVAEGEKATVKVTATGEGLKYAWWIAAAGSTKYTKSSVTGASYSVTMDASRAGRKLYCVVSDSYGNSVKTNTVTINMIPTLTITKQPTSVKVAEGEKATVKVTATGEGLSYAWWYAPAGSTKYSKSSVTGASYSVTMDATRAGRKLYCVVSDAYGNSVKSNTVAINMIQPLTITKQPTSVKVAEGEKATVKVTATGEGLKYAWWYAPAGSTTYSKSSITTASYSVTMNEARSGRKLYCVVTDIAGNTVKSNTVSIKMTTPLAITKQPVNAYAVEGATATVKVTATGDGLKYAWYIAAAGSSTFSKSSVTGASYSATMNAARSGRKLYCVVSDAYGNSVKTNTVTLKMIPVLTITKQPASVKVAEGAKATVKVTATGEGLKYTWWYAPAGSTKYSKSSVTGASYSVTMDATRAGRKLYCVVSDAYGNSVKSNTVTINLL